MPSSVARTSRPRTASALARSVCHPAIFPRNPYSVPSAVVTTRVWSPQKLPNPWDFVVRAPVIRSSGMTVTPPPPAAALLIACTLL